MVFKRGKALKFSHSPRGILWKKILDFLKAGREERQPKSLEKERQSDSVGLSGRLGFVKATD